jgi:hypothetical protein
MDRHFGQKINWRLTKSAMQKSPIDLQSPRQAINNSRDAKAHEGDEIIHNNQTVREQKSQNSRTDG